MVFLITCASLSPGFGLSSTSGTPYMMVVISEDFIIRAGLRHSNSQMKLWAAASYQTKLVIDTCQNNDFQILIP